MKKYTIMAVVAIMTTMILSSCSKDDDEMRVLPTPEEPVVLNCAKPDCLKAGDKVALISPSYFTPMETVEKAADVFRSWGFETVIGAPVTIDVRTDGATLTFDIDGEQQMVNTATINATPTPAASRMRMAGKMEF